MNNKYYAGVDIGSAGIKIVYISDNNDMLSTNLIPTTPDNIRNIANTSYLHSLGNDIPFERVCATGYGRNSVHWADVTATEISSQVKSLAALVGNGLIIDIGGQDTKLTKVTNFRLAGFTMNDRCAAGTGRFIEKAVSILGCSIEEAATTEICREKPPAIESTCTVFAETEMISLVAKGKTICQILNSLYYGLASRISNMVITFGKESNIVMTGGLAEHKCLIHWLQYFLNCQILVPPIPRFTAAYGAALIAKETTCD